VERAPSFAKPRRSFVVAAQKPGFSVRLAQARLRVWGSRRASAGLKFAAIRSLQRSLQFSALLRLLLFFQKSFRQQITLPTIAISSSAASSLG
jgi:hypothetical protein